MSILWPFFVHSSSFYQDKEASFNHSSSSVRSSHNYIHIFRIPTLDFLFLLLELVHDSYMLEIRNIFHIYILIILTKGKSHISDNPSSFFAKNILHLQVIETHTFGEQALAWFSLSILDLRHYGCMLCSYQPTKL